MIPLNTVPVRNGFNWKHPNSKWRMGIALVLVAITACSDDDAQREKREAAQKYYRSTVTVIPGDTEICLLYTSDAADE